MASDIWLRTILIVRKETRCRHIGYSYRLTARVLLYTPSQRQDNTYHGLCYTSRGALAGMRNSSMGMTDGGTRVWIDQMSPATSRKPFRFAWLCDGVGMRLAQLQFGSFMVDPLSYFLNQPVLHDWCNKGRGMCYPVCGMMHIKVSLLLFGKSSPCGGSGCPLSLSEWSFTDAI